MTRRTDRTRARFRTSRVPRCDWTDTTQRNRAHELMRTGAPVVLGHTHVAGRVGGRRAADDRPGLLGTWSSFDTLAVLGERDKRKWRCMTTSSGAASFTPPLQGNNVFGSHYHVRRPETDLQRYSLREFVQCAKAWKDAAVYLQDEVASIDARDTTVPSSGSPTPVGHVPGGDGIGRDIVEGIDWDWVEGLRRSQRFGPVQSVVLGAGTANSLLPAHHPTSVRIDSAGVRTRDVEMDPDEEAKAAAAAARDVATNATTYESLQCQVIGRRRILLVSPEQSYKGMYPYPISHPYDGYSMVDMDEVDYSRFPGIVKVRGLVCVLEPGDVLFVPDGWWRHEHGLTEEHACVELRMGTGGRARTAAAAVLAVGRSVRVPPCPPFYPPPEPCAQERIVATCPLTRWTVSRIAALSTFDPFYLPPPSVQYVHNARPWTVPRGGGPSDPHRGSPRREALARRDRGGRGGRVDRLGDGRRPPAGRHGTDGSRRD